MREGLCQEGSVGSALCPFHHLLPITGARGEPGFFSPNAPFLPSGVAFENLGLLSCQQTSVKHLPTYLMNSQQNGTSGCFLGGKENHKLCEFTSNRLVQTLYFRDEEERNEDKGPKYNSQWSVSDLGPGTSDTQCWTYSSVII